MMGYLPPVKYKSSIDLIQSQWWPQTNGPFLKHGKHICLSPIRPHKIEWQTFSPHQNRNCIWLHFHIYGYIRNEKLVYALGHFAVFFKLILGDVMKYKVGETASTSFFSTLINQLTKNFAYIRRKIWLNGSVSLCVSSRFNTLFSIRLYSWNMSEMLSVILILMGLTSYSVLARINFNEGPLFSAATSFTMELETTTLTKPTPCYVTSGDVSQCRRKRGIEESPQIAEISPSTVVGWEF